MQMSLSSQGPRRRLLFKLAEELAYVTPDEASHSSFEHLRGFLQQVRLVLGMDVAFVSRFIDDYRIIEVVSSAADSAQKLTVGDSDPLIVTYCHEIVAERLPRLIPDATALNNTELQPITEKLGVHAYLSAVVRRPDGAAYGTLCCFSHSSRPDLGNSDAEALQAVADAIAFRLFYRAADRSI